MPNVEANGIRIEYETFGDAAGRPLLLVMGLAQPMIVWPERFCELLADRGHFVVRFDNRDSGRSTTFEDAGAPTAFGTALRFWTGRPIRAPYTLDDMVDDAAGLLDALGIERVHLVGASMGGIISQGFAVEYPRRTASLTSIMANTGNPRYAMPKLRALLVALRRPPAERRAFVEYSVKLWRTIGSPGFPYREDFVRRRAARIHDRGNSPTGLARQLVAVAAAGDRRRDLARITCPTLVLHGEDDPLIPVAAGRETARAVPRAELLTFPGMGHDLPFELWLQIVDAISTHTERASAPES
jgi:pimeloyl-ACP methyl ester carboxylesterase